VKLQEAEEKEKKRLQNKTKLDSWILHLEPGVEDWYHQVRFKRGKNINQTRHEQKHKSDFQQPAILFSPFFSFINTIRYMYVKDTIRKRVFREEAAPALKIVYF